MFPVVVERIRVGKEEEEEGELTVLVTGVRIIKDVSHPNTTPYHHLLSSYLIQNSRPYNNAHFSRRHNNTARKTHGLLQNSCFSLRFYYPFPSADETMEQG